LILHEIIRDAISETEYSGDYRDCFGSKFQLRTIYLRLLVLPIIEETSLQETDFRRVTTREIVTNKRGEMHGGNDDSLISKYHDYTLIKLYPRLNPLEEELHCICKIHIRQYLIIRYLASLDKYLLFGT